MENSSEKPTAVVAGASGLVGTPLCESFANDGWVVRKLVRRPPRNDDEIEWSPAAGRIDKEALEGATAIVHLGGENVVQRWSDAAKRRIRDSRVDSTRLLAETIAALDAPPHVFCCASAIGYYGDRGDEIVDEQAQPGEGFLAEVCQQWEAAGEAAWQAGVRVCQARIGLVLAKSGGVIAKLLTPFRLGLGGVMGSGGQYMSWIVLDDLVQAIRFIVQSENLHGAVNCTAPHPVTNRHFTKALGAALGRPTLVTMPSFAARLAMGEMADEMLLAGQRVVPSKLLEAGFEFHYRDVEPALADLLKGA